MAHYSFSLLGDYKLSPEQNIFALSKTLITLKFIYTIYCFLLDA